MRLVVDEMPECGIDCLFYIPMYHDCGIQRGLSCKFNNGECPYLIKLNENMEIILECSGRNISSLFRENQKHDHRAD